MTMLQPPHPGRVIQRRILPALNITAVELAATMHTVNEADLVQVLEGSAPITESIAYNLEQIEIGDAEHWLRMQKNYDQSRSK